MTATAIVTGAVFPLHFIVVETCLINVVVFKFLRDFNVSDPLVDFIQLLYVVNIAVVSHLLMNPPIGMNLPSSRDYVAKIAATRVTSANFFFSIAGQSKEYLFIMCWSGSELNKLSPCYLQDEPLTNLKPEARSSGLTLTPPICLLDPKPLRENG